MIEKLDLVDDGTSNTEYRILRLPNNEEIMNKLNEVIDCVNIIEKLVIELNSSVNNIEKRNKINNMFK